MNTHLNFPAAGSSLLLQLIDITAQDAFYYSGGGALQIGIRQAEFAQAAPYRKLIQRRPRHYHVVPRADRTARVGKPRQRRIPVGHHHAGKAPLVAQDRGAEVMAVSSVDAD